MGESDDDDVITGEDPELVAEDDSAVEEAWAEIRRQDFDGLIAQIAACSASFVGTAESCFVEGDAAVSILTTCTMTVEQVLHGSIESASITLSQGGGCLGDVCLTSGHFPLLATGTRAAVSYQTTPAGLNRAAVVLGLDSSSTVGPDGISLDEFAAEIASDAIAADIAVGGTP